MSLFSKTAGLTLIEVVVAVFVLSVGVLAAAALQGSALQSSRHASITQQLTHLAEGELERQQRTLQSSLAVPATSASCASEDHPGYSCNVDITPCHFANGTLQCSASTPANLIKAYEVSVSVIAPQHSTLTLRTLVRRS